MGIVSRQKCAQTDLPLAGTVVNNGKTEFNAICLNPNQTGVRSTQRHESPEHRLYALLNRPAIPSIQAIK